jgi:excisionase family DNA binding protein
VSTTATEKYLTYAEASELTGLHRSTLWRAVRAGKLEVSGPVTAPRFREEALHLYMQVSSRN